MKHRIRDERSHLVLDWRDRLGAEPGGIALVLFQPKLPDVGILYPACDVPAVRGIDENPEHVAQRGIGLIEERQERVAENMLQPRSPGIRPDLFEGFEQSCCCERPSE